MAVMVKYWLLVLVLIHIFYFNCKPGKAEDDYNGVDGATADPAQADYNEVDGATTDPAQAVAKALLCFSNNYLYSSCGESYRLTESGTLNVPPEYADQYCNGPCQSETHLVLDCITNKFLHFEFYNRATTQDVREAIKTGCGYGSERGNFNVAQHLRTEESNANMITIHVLFVLLLILFAHCCLF